MGLGWVECLFTLGGLDGDGEGSNGRGNEEEPTTHRTSKSTVVTPKPIMTQVSRPENV